MSINTRPGVSSEGLGLIKLLLVNTVNFRNQHPRCHNCRLYNNHVKDTQGHSRSPLIISSSLALCCFPSVKQKHDFHFFVQCIIKQLLDSVLVISRIIKVSVRVISLSLQLRLITLTFYNPYLNLDYSGYHKNFIQ